MRRTVWGISLVGLGIGLSTASLLLAALVNPGLANFAGGGPLLAPLGFPHLLPFRGPRESAHRVRVFAGILVGLAALVTSLALPSVLGSTGPYPAAFVATERTEVTLASATVLLGCISFVLGTVALQDRTGRLFLVAGLSAAVLVQVVLWILLNGTLDRLLSEGLAAGGFYPLIDIRSEWTSLGALNAIPLGLILLAYERLYWQLHRRYFRHASLLDV